VADHDTQHILLFPTDKVQLFVGICQQIAAELIAVSIAFSKDAFSKKNTFLIDKK
jgi:hypothetical protein